MIGDNTKLKTICYFAIKSFENREVPIKKETHTNLQETVTMSFSQVKWSLMDTLVNRQTEGHITRCFYVQSQRQTIETNKILGALSETLLLEPFVNPTAGVQ